MLRLMFPALRAVLRLFSFFIDIRPGVSGTLSRWADLSFWLIISMNFDTSAFKQDPGTPRFSKKDKTARLLYCPLSIFFIPLALKVVGKLK